jgi:hypothetical protein
MIVPNQMTSRRCFQCETENPPEQSFCGSCGSALVLKDYIAGQVTKELETAVRDRDVLETESAIRVFEQAWKWTKLFLEVLAVPFIVVVTLLGWLGWKEFDLSKTAQNQKEQIESTANTARNDIGQVSAKSVEEIQKESGKTIEANRDSAANAIRLSDGVKATASKTTKELQDEAASVRTEVANSKSEIEAVKQLQPEFDSMRTQLGKATSDLAAQQKVISSSEDFVKHVFSMHATYMFSISEFVQANAIVIPAPQGVKNSTVYMLVPDTPVDGTLQLQWGVYAQPPNSYLHIHNLIIFFWGENPNNLKANALAVSFFADKSDRETIKTLSFRDGRAYADDQPLPKFFQPDPEFKGNKWMPFISTPPPLQPSPIKP